MQTWRLFNQAPKFKSDVKIKRILTVSFDPLPFKSTAKLLRARNETNWNTFLARPRNDYDMIIFVKSRQVELLNVFKIDDQHFMIQICLHINICLPNARLSCGASDSPQGAASFSLWLGADYFKAFPLKNV